ncbi:hypothetical protein BC938DRAFT_479726 [Jimgerdemannia flammicorona]|uniref:Cyclic nucleotide-binding domain-containing protein n=1 Tax=Jimgerdemannia flammicorona TaxID=994334 RepID=A0A433QXR8_9FUNG|nr:hypothetical protein BC938DRAFT_479726 [Jimgerdemannia flammicorona]
MNVDPSSSSDVTAVLTAAATAVADAAAAANPTATAATSRSLLSLLPSFLFNSVTFATITIPTLLFRVLTWSFTLHLNFTSLLIILGILATGTYILVRYRVLTIYSRLTPTEATKPAATSFDLHPDPAGDSEYAKPEFKNYPDEFLSAFLSSIKIFGYLEQPVFHELARHLQTKKLLEGDTLFRNPEQERSFYIVVDGHVQVFVKPNSQHRGDAGDEGNTFGDGEDQDEFSQYQLLNEVGAGGTLSSLFTILSLFTEDTKVKGEEDRLPPKPTRRGSGVHLDPTSTAGEGGSVSRDSSQEGWSAVFPHLDNSDNEATIEGTRRRAALRKSGSPLANTQLHTTGEDSDDEGEETADRHEYTDEPRRVRKNSNGTTYTGYASSGRGRRNSTASRVSQATYATNYRPTSVHPNIVARATVDTTLVVIPAEAFHRLTEKFPKSAAHIVQVILTRFQRVTFLTGHRYLGLTKELLRIEKTVNESASNYCLPADFFRPGEMERLRKKFVGGGKKYVSGTTSGVEGDNERDELSDNGLMARSASSNGRFATRTSNRSSLWLDRLGGSEASGHVTSPRLSPGPIEIPNLVSPTNATFTHPLAPSPPLPTLMVGSPPTSKSHFRRGSGSGLQQPEYDEQDERHLRNSVMECLSRSMGLPSPSSQLAAQPTPFTSRSTSSARSSSPPASGRYNPSNLDLFSHTGSTSSLLGSTVNDYDNLSNTSHGSGTNSPTASATASATGVFDSKDGNDVNILFFPKGSILVKEGQRNAGLFFVIDGLLDVSMKPAQGEDLSLGSAVAKAEMDEAANRKHRRTASKKEQPQQKGRSSGKGKQEGRGKERSDKSDKPLFMIKAGGMAGYLAALSGYPSFVNIRASTDTYVGYLSKQSLDRIIEKNPTVMMTLAKRMIGILSPLILHIDFALEWVQVAAGQILYREGDRSDSIYIVLNGRLRTITEKSGGIEILAEYGQGESVGELDVLTDTPRPSTLHAIRDSELARMPKTLFNTLALRHPEITMQISRIIALRSRQMIYTTLGPGQTISSTAHTTFPELYGKNNVNLKTIGILPVTAGVPVAEFAERLRSALENSVGASTVLLNSATVTAVTGKHAFSQMGKLKLTNWLAEQEERAKIVLYLADSGVTSQWTRTCIRQVSWR